MVRELNAKRAWIGEALLSSNADEVGRLLARAHEWASTLKLPVRLWLSDKQDAFVKGIAAEFPGVPHRYCQNHFLRDLAKPVLEKDSHAKVQMRKHVRGLRDVEREVLGQRRQAPTEAETPPGAAASCEEGATAGQPAPAAAPEAGAAPASPRMAGSEVPPQGPGRAVPAGASSGPGPRKGQGAPAGASRSAPDKDGQIVLAYCAAVRGTLNDDPGGPLTPPGLRMAVGLRDVQASLQRNLALNKPGAAHGQLERLAGCIEQGLGCVKEDQEEVRQQTKEIARVAATLEEKAGSNKERRGKYEKLQEEYEGKGGTFYGHLARVMLSFMAGLFVGRKGKKGLTDNLDLERWFRKPKGHERRIHGRRHAGVRIVQEGPTLVLVLDARVPRPLGRRGPPAKDPHVAGEHQLRPARPAGAQPIVQERDQPGGPLREGHVEAIEHRRAPLGAAIEVGRALGVAVYRLDFRAEPQLLAVADQGANLVPVAQQLPHGRVAEGAGRTDHQNAHVPPQGLETSGPRARRTARQGRPAHSTLPRRPSAAMPRTCWSFAIIPRWQRLWGERRNFAADRAP